MYNRTGTITEMLEIEARISEVQAEINSLTTKIQSMDMDVTYSTVTIDIEEDTVKYYGTFEAQAHGKTEGIIVKMTCYMADFEGELEASSEIQEIKWLSYCDLDKISPVDKLIFVDLHEKNLLS